MEGYDRAENSTTARKRVRPREALVAKQYRTTVPAPGARGRSEPESSESAFALPRLTGFRPDPPPKVRKADSFIYANAGRVLPLPWGEERLAVGGGGGAVLPLP